MALVLLTETPPSEAERAIMLLSHTGTLAKHTAQRKRRCTSAGVLGFGGRARGDRRGEWMNE